MKNLVKTQFVLTESLVKTDLTDPNNLKYLRPIRLFKNNGMQIRQLGRKNTDLQSDKNNFVTVVWTTGHVYLTTDEYACLF